VVADRIEAAGLSIHRDDIALRGLRHAGRVAWFVDPFGQRHELAVGPRDQSAFVPGKPMRGTFVTGNAGFGHVVMVTPDLDATTAFYTEVLGFRPSDAFRFAAAPGVRGLHHLMFELSDLDDVGRAYDRLADFDIPATVTLGRHPNDCMLSFYARVPGGFDIEWGHKPQAAA